MSAEISVCQCQYVLERILVNVSVAIHEWVCEVFVCVKVRE